MAAGVLFRDKSGRVLLLDPSYKPNWEIPGGAVESAWCSRMARSSPPASTAWKRPGAR
nr:NUDIX hydrolase [Lentzea kentuckyensis]